MYALIEQWQQSGISQKAFCSEHSLTVLKFQYWHKRYKAEKLPDESNEPSFIKMSVPVAQMHGHSVGQAEVVFPNGIRILLHQEVSAHFLKALV
jgi:hypothetical protein